MIALSIMIAYAPWHQKEFEYISTKIQKQIDELGVGALFVGEEPTVLAEIVSDGRGREVALGKKRNEMLERCRGLYCCAVDADDDVSDDYVRQIINHMLGKKDTLGMKILMTTDDKRPQFCYHSLTYPEWKDGDNCYYRSVTQFNPTLTSLCRMAKFPEDMLYGDDHEFSRRVTKLCKSETMIEDVIYFYKFKTTPATEKGFA